MKKGQQTKVYPIKAQARPTPPPPKINYPPPAPNKVPKKRSLVPEIFKLTAILLVSAISLTVLSGLVVGYTHDYITEMVPEASQKSAPSEPHAFIDENDAPMIPASVSLFYDYTRPVPRSETVDIGYFDDTVFIGDSRTKGLLMYTDLAPMDFSGEGANVSTVQTKSYIRLKDENGELRSYTLAEALRYKDGEYKAIYISLGLNELGWSADKFISAYESLIWSIRRITDVPIYIQLILPVTKHAEETSKFGITNAKQKLFNERLIRFSVRMRLFRLDPIDLFSLDDGTLDPTHASDGIHLHPSSYKIVEDYLRSHVVDTEMYADTRREDPVWAPEGVFTSADNITPIA